MSRAPFPSGRRRSPATPIQTAISFLYRLLWRLASEPKLLEIASDPDVIRLGRMEKAVRRDCHKMRAFVRFVQVGGGEGERFVAWFEPEHFIVERNAPFFMRRFTGMRWTILTPKGSADWDGEKLLIGPAASRADAPAEDAQNDLWRTYFASIFNPARLKVKAMQAEMPKKKYWRNLPEAALIPDLIKGAEKSAREMIDRMPTTPAPHHAKVQERYWSKAEEAVGTEGEAATLSELARQAEGCRRCPLWRDATQTVFGEGPGRRAPSSLSANNRATRRIWRENLLSVRRAGCSTRVLAEAGVDRRLTYVTNAVKHFKFEPRGKRRIHAKTQCRRGVTACSWWLGNELRLIGPDVAVALGATAAQALLGRAVAVTKERGRILPRERRAARLRDGASLLSAAHSRRRPRKGRRARALPGRHADG